MSTIRANILLIEGKHAERPSFFSGLTKKGFHVDSVSSGSAALTFLTGHHPHIVLLDSASMRSSGKRICQSIHQKYPGLPILMVLEEGSDPATRTDADVALVLPFTLQKLLNRIRPLLPNDDEDVMKVGPLELNTEQRWVRLRNRQAQLTPRLVILLKALMERPGEVIERSDLFRLVWDTAYIGDTRTLDVHISWLRQAVEDDPRHPKLIKTVRGYGYRLDVEASANPETRPLKPVEAPAVDLSPETHN